MYSKYIRVLCGPTKILEIIKKVTQCIAPLSSYTPIWGSIFPFSIFERLGRGPTALSLTRHITSTSRRDRRATAVAAAHHHLPRAGRGHPAPRSRP